MWALIKPEKKGKIIDRIIPPDEEVNESIQTIFPLSLEIESFVMTESQYYKTSFMS